MCNKKMFISGNKIYSIRISFKNDDGEIITITDEIQADDSNIAHERFIDKHDINHKIVVSTYIKKVRELC